MQPLISLLAGLFAVLWAGGKAPQEAPVSAAPMEVIFDTDIGDDIDDAYALALLTRLPNAKLLGVTTSHGETAKRAQLAAKLLKVIGRPNIPVYAGRASDFKITRQYEWAKDFQSSALKSESAVEFMRRTIEKSPGKVTIIAVGALTNLGDLLKQYPDTSGQIKQIVIMGGGVHVGYNNQPPIVPEFNILCDPEAAKIVYLSGIPLTMAGLEATTMLKFDVERQKRLFGQGTALGDALASLTALWGQSVPTLYDSMAVAWGLGYRFCDSEMRRVVVEKDGITRPLTGTPNAKVLINPRKDAFLDWHIKALAGNP